MYKHANNVIAFTNKSKVNFDQERNFSFMHAVFAILLEVDSFKEKFSKGGID